MGSFLFVGSSFKNELVDLNKRSKFCFYCREVEKKCSVSIF